MKINFDRSWTVHEEDSLCAIICLVWVSCVFNCQWCIKYIRYVILFKFGISQIILLHIHLFARSGKTPLQHACVGCIPLRNKTVRCVHVLMFYLHSNKYLAMVSELVVTLWMSIYCTAWVLLSKKGMKQLGCPEFKHWCHNLHLSRACSNVQLSN